jgi:hypothetical protein
MEGIKPFEVFFAAIQKDARISISHIGFFAALLQTWHLQEYQNPFSTKKEELMKVAKISSPTTYHKCLRDLHDFGYIRYEPSYKPKFRSKVYLLF